MTIAQNPVLGGFYPDPSICRVGTDYYLVNSSFAYAPGVPVFHSRDLAHWEQIGNVLERDSQLRLDGQEISRGIFAPTIRYHEGVYYVITTNVSYGGTFVVTATDPAGPWSDPMELGDGAAGIDPSLFFDDDGRCYYVGTRPNPQGTVYDGDWEIWLQELDLEHMRLTGESMAIWKGAAKHAIWPEGPHLYKKDGYYYLLIAEGGTELEHSICMARSRELFAWYEGCTRNPVFTHRHLGHDYPVICAGHGDLVDDENGSWYIVMLASRASHRHCSLGRETYLARVVWEDGWPVVNPGVGVLEQRVQIPLPEYRFAQEVNGDIRLDFANAESDDRLDPRLVSMICRDEGMYSLTQRPGWLRLYTAAGDITQTQPCAYLGVRQSSYDCTVRCRMEFCPQSEHETAGLVLYQNHENHLRIELGIEPGIGNGIDTGGSDICGNASRALCVTEHICGIDHVAAVYPLQTDGAVELMLTLHDQKGAVSVTEDGVQIHVAQDLDLMPYTTEAAGGFVGCTIGMYASGHGTDCDNHADIAWFTYKNDSGH